jgi:hypothetical protein
MVQVFRRDHPEEAAKDLRLRGLDAAATCEVTNLDSKTPTAVSGSELMQRGLHVELTEKRAAAFIIIYKKVP